MKSNAKKIALQSLIKILYNEFNNLFLNVKSFFIQAVMKFVIQQKLLNLHYIINSNKNSQKDSELTILSVLKEIIVKEFFWTLTFYLISVMINIKNFSIQVHILQNATVRQSDWPSQLSVVTIRDVLSDPHLNNNNFITQMSFKLWADILHQDVNYTESHAIRYTFTDGLLHIKQDRHFHTALLDAQRQSLSYAMFDITLLSPAHEYIVFI